jgi:hypothetical protein
MNKNVAILRPVVLTLFLTFICTGQESRIANVNEYPKLGVPLEKVARLKLAVRKTNYLKGEMLAIDIAVLQQPNLAGYFPAIENVQLSVENQRGEDILIPYLIRRTSATLKPSQPEEIQTMSELILIGCEERAFEINTLLGSASASEVFEKSLFTNWGQGCAKIQKESQIIIRATLSNSKVLINSNGQQQKTAVGILNSDTLSIFVGTKSN